MGFSGGLLHAVDEIPSRFVNDTRRVDPANVLVIEDSAMIRDRLVDIINADPGGRVTAHLGHEP